MAYSKEKMREYQREWCAKNRAAYLMGKSCVECGSTTNLEVDHIDPEQKVSHRIWSWSLKRRLAELAKCQTLCTDCHKVKTKAQRPAPDHGTEARYASKTYGCRCELCRAANAAGARARKLRRQQATHDLAA